MNELLDKTQVASLLKVSTRSIDRLRKAGKLGAVIICNRVRFRPTDVESFISNQIESPQR
ncbi:MAG: Helix-turn-helix domain [Schlesneria sp.]|nr:Helix-turn-helix domain [Schlesneria sp.]